MYSTTRVTEISYSCSSNSIKIDIVLEQTTGHKMMTRLQASTAGQIWLTAERSGEAKDSPILAAPEIFTHEENLTFSYYRFQAKSATSSGCFDPPKDSLGSTCFQSLERTYKKMYGGKPLFHPGRGNYGASIITTDHKCKYFGLPVGQVTVISGHRPHLLRSLGSNI